MGITLHDITCSLKHSLQWMGAVRMRVQTADKNITIIHMTPVHQLTSCEVKSCLFVRNKFIIKTLLTSWIKSKSIILLSPIKQSSHLNLERNMHRSSTVYKWKQSKIVLNKYVSGFWCERTTGAELFSAGGSVIMDYGLLFWPEATAYS